MMNHENIDEIVKVLQADSALTDMLAANRPYYKTRTLSMSKVNSIMPMDFIDKKKNMPVVGVRAGVQQKVGVNLIDVILMVRCYNELDKTYVDINKVLSRIQELLDGTKVTLTGMTNIDTQFESIGQDSEDEGFELRFRELQFRMQII